MISNFNKINWIKGLDSLRFILALTVLLSHLHVTEILSSSDSIFLKLLKPLIGNAFVGVAAVIAFFVISGIVIHLPYKGKTKVEQPVSYLLRRYLRIGIPMIAVIVFAFVFNLKVEIFPFWSLYCELFYYTIFPLLLLAIRKYGIDKVLIISFILSYILVLVFSNNLSDFIHQNKIYDGNYWQLGVLKTCIVGLPCWLLGVKIAEELNTINKQSISSRKVYLIRLCVFIAAFTCSVARFHLSLSYLLSLNLFAILAYYWIKSEIIFWKDRKPIRFLENVGKWSYSLYLCHALGIVMITHIFSDRAFTFYMLLLQLISSLIISYIFYLLVEKPGHQLVRKIKLRF